MLQRIQTIYLFLVSLIAIVSTWFANLWKTAIEWIQPEDNIPTFVMFLLSAILSLICIFLYNNRSLQMKLNSFNILLNVLLIGLLVYYLLALPGGFDSEKGIGLIVPFVLIVLLLMANQKIKKDEKLVKSIDRIR